MHAVVVVNRRANELVRDGPLLAALRRARAGVRVVETYSLADLDAAARAVREDATSVVALAGGDGSYMAGVTALCRAFGGDPLPAIALLPGGTVSTVARNWGFRGDPVRYTSCILAAIRRGATTTTARPTLLVRDGSGAGRVGRVGFIVGAGLVARFFEAYVREGARGYAGAARIVARVFAGSFVGGALARRILEPVPCAIDVDGAAAPFQRISLACASVVRDLGLSMKLLYRAGERADRFHVVATPLGPSRLGPQMPLVLAGRPLLGPRIDTLAGAFAMRFPTGDGAYVLDGELLRADVVDVTAGPTLAIVDA